MMPPPANIQRIGVLLAAGRGRRMGGQKQFYPWPTTEGNKPLVAAAFDAIRAACDEMIVVLGHQSDAVAKVLEKRSFQPVSSDPDDAMFESIRAGLQRAQALAPAAQVLLHPGDHPEVAPDTLRAMINKAAEHPESAILPEYQGRGGHPVLIPPSLSRRLLQETCPDGLRQFWKDHPHVCVRLPVDDPCVVRDVDTPGASV